MLPSFGCSTPAVDEQSSQDSQAALLVRTAFFGFFTLVTILSGVFSIKIG